MMAQASTMKLTGHFEKVIGGLAYQKRVRRTPQCFADHVAIFDDPAKSMVWVQVHSSRVLMLVT